jgi:hypothetical protein
MALSTFGPWYRHWPGVSWFADFIPLNVTTKAETVVL